MNTWLDRTELLIKRQGLEKLNRANVLVVGLGGVGAFACEFLARAGIGSMTIVDGDVVSSTNKNRQLLALDSTVGQKKAFVMRDRLLDINPELNLVVIDRFLEPQMAYDLVCRDFSCVADCIDSITPKLNIIASCRDKGVPLVSSMGSGGVLNPSKVMVCDISKTFNCPLARNIRKRLKSMGGGFKFKAVFSSELTDESSMQTTCNDPYKKSFYGTISYMPAAFGISLASQVISDILNQD